VRGDASDRESVDPGAARVGLGRGQIGAAVDVGSTSVHLLVARVIDHRIEPLIDESLFLGLGAAVETRGMLGTLGRRELVDALATYASRGRQAGATGITFVGTEPLRRFADAARIVAEVDAATGAPLHVLGHEEEAFLNLIGVTEGRPVEHDVLVVDIGGGSSEFVSIGPGKRAVATGVRVGAARLTGRHVTGDPPRVDELVALRAAAAQAIGSAPVLRPAEIVLVGGTASNLLKVVPGGLTSRRLTWADLDNAFTIVAGRSADAVADEFLVKPARARILAAGAAIVEAIMTRFGVGEVRVGDAGLREGTVIAVAHAGSSWRDRLEELAHGWIQ
jgi:exopolyphosphatase/guanosine-5'-triphosphate,3'-diphosphate pyrophosphatase